MTRGGLALHTGPGYL